MIALGVSLLLVASPAASYDSNQSGYIERDEAYRAIRDYFDAGLSQEQVIDVLLHYWGNEPVTPNDVSSTILTPTPTPTATPTPMVQAPTITYVRVNTASLQFN